jgi:hypothetical protein
LSGMALSITTLSITKLRIITLYKAAQSMMTLRITKFNIITQSIMTLSITVKMRHSAKHNAEFRN